jgi:hypothetical protein
MFAFRSRRGIPRHLVWLLSAALLLPVAQTAATWHMLSLACVDQGDVHGKPYSHPSRCDFCLTAAGFSSVAANTEAASLPRPVSLHESPLAPSTFILSALAELAYRCRAPPTTPY